MAISPTMEGFRAAFRQPSLTLAEIAWRWTVGATAATLLAFCLFEFIDTLPVSKGDRALLATGQPLLVSRAFAHILSGSLNRATWAALTGIVGLSVLWILAASVGRLAIVQALIAHFQTKFSKLRSTELSDRIATSSLPSLVTLNFFRLAVLVALLLAVRGAFLVSGFVSSDARPHRGLMFLVFAALIGGTCIAAWTLDWWLSLSAMFALRNNQDAISTISDAVLSVRGHLGSFLAVTIWTGLANLVAFSVATTVVSLPLAFIGVAPPRLAIGCMLLVSLVYFAVADWLHMARLAGYICIVEMPEPAPVAPQISSGRPAPLATTIDRTETILSDLPNLAFES